MERNGYINAVIEGKNVESDDLALIKRMGNYVVFKGCLFKEISPSTLSETVVFHDCRFDESYVCVPNPSKQVLSCIFYDCEKAIRTAKVVNGYHTPLRTPKYV